MGGVFLMLDDTTQFSDFEHCRWLKSVVHGFGNCEFFNLCKSRDLQEMKGGCPMHEFRTRVPEFLKCFICGHMWCHLQCPVCQQWDLMFDLVHQECVRDRKSCTETEAERPLEGNCVSYREDDSSLGIKE